MNPTSEPTTPSSATRIDWTALRQRLAQATGREYWRSLDELADSEAFHQFLHAEFPRQASVLDEIGRRQFLQLMGASLALAGLSACTKQPAEKIVPYVKAPEELIPGVPRFYATAAVLGGMATGILVESQMGRPTKIEGNPDHPASLGATDAFTQASILALYDPDRSQVIRNVTDIRPWSAFVAAVSHALDAQKSSQGAGIRFLTETVTSPTLTAQLRQLLGDFPQAKWHQYEPAGRDNARAGALLAFGEAVDTRYLFENADVIVSLGSDFLAGGPGSVRYVREHARRRRVHETGGTMNRLYVVESEPTVTGAAADHRLAVRPSEIEAFARALATASSLLVENPAAMAEHAAWIKAAAGDLGKSRGRSIVLAGDEQAPSVHALAHLLNQALGNVGQTVVHTEPVEAQPVDQLQSLRELVADMDAGKVDLLLMLGGNPVYTSPADLRFSERLDKVRMRIHVGLHDDETAELCQWHIPETHPLETWSDARAYDGTITILQPLIAPLYEGKSFHEVLAAFAGWPSRSSHDIVRDYWKQTWGSADSELRWHKALHDGVVVGSAAKARDVSVSSSLTSALPPLVASPQGLELSIRTDPTIFDGRFANNGWLQELPKPISKLTWDNAAFVSPRTAERLGLQDNEVVELRYQGRSVNAPVAVLPGHANDCVTIHLGYGRSRGGRVANGAGFNAYKLRSVATPWGGPGLEIQKTGEHYQLASTQNHSSMEGRDLVRSGTLDEYRRHPSLAPEAHGPPIDANMSLYSPLHHDGYAWGMSIDLNSCTGCNSCVVACQSENNIAVVGKDQVWRGREMHWIRIDRYYSADLDNPEIYHQPVPCMHCENAPCEVVCPVNATVHDSEGLNEMIYNRCVGTKYCSNNCPYKVRRFNFFRYQDLETESLKLMRNPDVTVRSRGVMEKCTYCVQRINEKRIQAKREDRTIRDGEIVTACQQACPAEAIVFGDINDPNSRVSQLRSLPRRYALLEELNTRPRTTYLAALRNPNPELASERGKT
jgi:molybdopterin-containing oxidoreductase family iron-sulfur binding subunit